MARTYTRKGEIKRKIIINKRRNINFTNQQKYNNK